MTLAGSAGRVGSESGWHQVDVQRMGAGGGDVEIMRVQAAGQNGAVATRCAHRHHHRFGRRRRAVVHRRVGDFHAGHQRDLGLEFVQVLKRALRHFRLIGGVGGEKFTALHQIIHRRRDVVAIGPGAQKARRGRGRQVLRRKTGEGPFDLHLTHKAGQVHGFVQQRLCRHVAKHILDRTCADGFKHGFAVFFSVRQITHQHEFLIVEIWS